MGFMTDEEFEQFLKNAARDYNAPPEIIPREEIWDRIHDAQRVIAESPLRLERGGAAAGESRTRSAPLIRWWSLAAAAILLLIAGIGIDRFTPLGKSRVAQNAVAKSPPKQPGVLASKTEPSPSQGGARTAGKPEEPPLNSRAARETKPALASREKNGNSSDALYMLASVRHLTEAEAMLTQFRQDTINKQTDAAVANWSRDLLSNTRLLLDSPAARDPRRKRLLEDLELVLTQIVQLNTDPNAKDREMIESTIKRGNVMTRLRTAIPAGQPKGS
jgi:hypothetical protein